MYKEQIIGEWGLARILRSSIALTPVKTGKRQFSSPFHSSPFQIPVQWSRTAPTRGKKPWEKPWERPSSVWYSSLQCRWVYCKCRLMTMHCFVISSPWLRFGHLNGTGPPGLFFQVLSIRLKVTSLSPHPPCALCHSQSLLVDFQRNNCDGWWVLYKWTGLVTKFVLIDVYIISDWCNTRY